MNKKPVTIISGSGLSALMLAKMIKKYKNPNANIIIVECENEIGGQFGSRNYGKHGCFDYGMHIYYESSIAEIDTLFTSILPDSDWHILTDNSKDIAGIYVNGVLQLDTPYVDLRNYPLEKKAQYLYELFSHIDHNSGKKLPASANAYEILKHQFGELIATEVFVPIMIKLYKTHPSNLDELATNLTTINRVALFNESTMLNFMEVPDIRSRICYANQHSMPTHYRKTTQRGFYPKQYGMSRVLDKFRASLEADGVIFSTASMISKLNIHNNRLESVSITTPEGVTELSRVDKLYWSSGLPPLAKALNLNLSNLQYDRQVNTAYYVNFLFSKNPEMGKLYYFYCFDKGFRTFRVTNYSNYCPAANEGRGYPLCVELWLNDGDTDNENEIVALSLNELRTFGVINDAHKMQFSKIEKAHRGGFPLPTITNVKNINYIREMIAQLQIKNVIPVGMYSSNNIFFIKDVLLDIYKKIME